MTRLAKLTSLATLPCALMGLNPSLARAADPTPAKARAIVKEAYIYGFSVLDNYRIQHTYYVDRTSPEFKAPWN
jgi:hypothetical protein